ncbi:transposase [Lancefieldella rimae]
MSWKDFLTSLKERRLSGARLVVFYAHAGLVRAIGGVISSASWQRRLCHLERNIFERCRTKVQGKAVLSAMKHTFEKTGPNLVRTGFEHLVRYMKR